MASSRKTKGNSNGSGNGAAERQTVREQRETMQRLLADVQHWLAQFAAVEGLWEEEDGLLARQAALEARRAELEGALGALQELLADPPEQPLEALAVQLGQVLPQLSQAVGGGVRPPAVPTPPIAPPAAAPAPAYAAGADGVPDWVTAALETGGPFLPPEEV